MAKINIMQLLCRERHCIVAVAYDPLKTTDEQAIDLLKTGLKAIKANEWCGLCGSRQLKFERGATKFDSLAAAGAFLVEEEQKNLATRRIIETMRRAARNN